MGFPILGTKISFLTAPIFAFSIYFYFLNESKTQIYRFIYTLLFSLGFYLMGFYWIPGTLTEFGQIGAPLNHILGSLSVFVICPHLFLFSIIDKHLNLLKKAPSLDNILRSLFIATQYITPQLFSAYPGHAWLKLAPHLFPAKYFGEYIFSFISILMALEIKHLYINKKFNRFNWGFISLFSLSCFIPNQKINKAELFPINVRISQANIGNNAKLSAERGLPNSVNKVLTTYKDLSTDLPYQHIDLILWPETAFPYSLHPNILKGSLDKMPPVIQEIVNRTKADIFFGSYLRDLKNNYSKTFNSAFFARKQGINTVYNKNRLIPFGESLPFTKSINSAIYQMVPGISLFSRSNKTQMFESKTKKGNNYHFIGLICYEALAPELLRSHINTLNLMPNFMTNLTNDSWFRKTSEPEQHLFLSKWRTVEFGIPMVRVANTGISSIIDRDGVELIRGKTHSVDKIDGTIFAEENPKKTVFLKFGILPFLVLWLLFVAISFLLSRKSLSQ